MPKAKVFILYDGRAKLGNTDEASVYTVANSEAEARGEGNDDAWQDGIWYEYDAKGNDLINEKARFDLPPACKE